MVIRKGMEKGGRNDRDCYASWFADGLVRVCWHFCLVSLTMTERFAVAMLLRTGLGSLRIDWMIFKRIDKKIEIDTMVHFLSCNWTLL